jgi:cytoskeletal protein CcmA (bactofilin family)
MDGSAEGTIHLDSKLIVGKTAKLIADISAQYVVVSGSVRGDVRASGQIEIRKGGSVVGDVTTAQILIEDGADFRGSIDIDRGEDKVSSNGVYSAATTAAKRA